MIFSAPPIRPLIPDLTAPVIESPIFVPRSLNVLLILSQIPKKNSFTPEKTFLIRFQASENFSPNHDPTFANAFLILFQIFPNHSPAAFQAFLMPSQAFAPASLILSQFLTQRTTMAIKAPIARITSVIGEVKRHVALALT